MKIRFGFIFNVAEANYINSIENDGIQGLYLLNIRYTKDLKHLATSSCAEPRQETMMLNLKRFIRVGYSSNILEERFKV